MHLFTNDYEIISAADVDDVWALWCDLTGNRRADFEAETEWRQIPDSQPVAIDVDGVTETKPASEWAGMGRRWVGGEE
jgi:hypothetical protein